MPDEYVFDTEEAATSACEHMCAHREESDPDFEYVSLIRERSDGKWVIPVPDPKGDEEWDTEEYFA